MHSANTERGTLPSEGLPSEWGIHLIPRPWVCFRGSGGGRVRLLRIWELSRWSWVFV